MSKASLWRRSLRGVLVLSITLSTSAWAESSSVEWIYPGEALPADLGFTPLLAGVSADAEVRVQNRDWFLLKKKVNGPILNSFNAQPYFRIVTGVILQQSMLQMGMSSVQARRWLQDNTTAEKLNDENINTLPEGLRELAKNWEKPVTKIANLPYFILPLSIGMDRSTFLHFTQGALEETNTPLGAKMCSMSHQALPIQAVQSELEQTQKQLDILSDSLKQAEGLYAQSNAEFVRLTSKVKLQSEQIQTDMQCLAITRERVSRGSEMPSSECLARLSEILQAQNATSAWEKFVTVNLTNVKGDFQTLKEEQISLEAKQVALASTQTRIQDIETQKANLKEVNQANERQLTLLKDDNSQQKELEARLNKEEADLNEEFQTLQKLNQKLESGILSTELPEDQVQSAVAGTAERTKRLSSIKARLPELLAAKTKVQQNLTAILSQQEYLAREIDTQRLKLESLDNQLGDNAKGLLNLLETQKKEVELASASFFAATQQSNHSEYILSLLDKNLIENTQSRDQTFLLLKKEEILVAEYKAQVETASTNKTTQWGELQKKLQDQAKIIAPYRDELEMGWFLESECQTRLQYDTTGVGIYLSRQPVTENASLTIGQRADGGQWGLFNMPYEAFKNSIQNGVLLNLESYVDLSVRKMHEKYDASMVQFLNPLAEKCESMNSSNIVSSLDSLLSTVSRIWSSDSGYCASKQEQESLAAQSFKQNLKELIQFSGSVLDTALPKTGASRPQDLLEREAVEALTEEYAILTGAKSAESVSSQDRRDRLIISMVRVLANDYYLEQEQMTLSESHTAKYKFAKEAPGNAVVSSVPFSIGATMEIKSIDGVALYAAPNSDPTNLTSVQLGFGDAVKLEILDTKLPEQAMMAGWLKVRYFMPDGQLSQETYFLPAWAVTTNSLTDSNGTDVTDLSDANCPVRRIVKSLINTDSNNSAVMRFLPELQTGFSKKNGMWQILYKTDKTTPAIIGKVYIACELFSVEGQTAAPAGAMVYTDDSEVDYQVVQGIRIVEARVVTAIDGSSRYVPTEKYGGFVPTWLVKNKNRPRILLGEKIDPRTLKLVE